MSDVGYGLGVDLGTTFTAAAVCGHTGTRMVPLGPDIVTPSVAFARPDGTLLTGATAEAAGATDPTRVSRGHKRRLGDPTPLVIGGTAYSPAALLAAQLRDLVSDLTAMEGTLPEAVVLTCPAVWGPYRREHFDEVPRLAGISGVRMVTEPEAAAMHYSVERRLGDGELVAVYDLGGGTFDATILRARPGGMEILGTPEGIERLGGMDFDEALLAHVDSRLDGAIDALDPADPEAATALATIRALCVRAKEDLSVEPDVTLRLPLPGGPREVNVTRVEFNDMIRPSVALTTEALHRTITSAGLRPTDLAGVLMAGGSSRIPLVPQMVSATFGKPVRVSLHPKFTVALGAAALAQAAITVPSPQTAPANVTPDAVPSATSTGRRPKWLLPAVGAAAAVVVATTAVLTGGSDTGDAGGSTSSAPPQSSLSRSAAVALPDLEVFTGRDVGPYTGLLGAAEDGWASTALGAGRAASNGSISAAPDGAKAIRVSWSGVGPAQFYVQRNAGSSDLRPYVADSALVVDVVVHRPPTARTALAVHCVFPCAAELDASSVFRAIKPGQKRTLKIPVRCFTDAGLNAAKVNTPFLVVTAGTFEASFGDVRWKAGAADDADATPCDDLR
ncbi:actin-like ATPase involved in cell morphogenesis [Saccharothrix ecbatanensis]|uniref:Actin-like ATPase involved in cell morphogenesis n=1 Tax=Saccharothrix ecbatanensis TaxID=1105145 RepID=A0A7W9HIH0_9PSEU|nr:Hsp70 family protein [Saccharothrix ecbatanensis]MBB5802942.1 actin-like ATPase involved in cell morphogenesis [Saccharothrix ecbatanensis]